jgi:hypothetical protein
VTQTTENSQYCKYQPSYITISITADYFMLNPQAFGEDNISLVHKLHKITGTLKQRLPTALLYWINAEIAAIKEFPNKRKLLATPGENANTHKACIYEKQFM